MFLADRNCINDATHIGTSEKAWTSGIGVGRMMTFPMAMVIGLIGLVRILSILLIFGASVLFGLQRGAVCGDTAIWIWLVSVQSTNYFARRG